MAPGYSAVMAGFEHSPYVAVVIGATTMLSRQDPIEVQLGGAIANGELTNDQLDELLLLLLYAGARRTTTLMRGLKPRPNKGDDLWGRQRQVSA